jgi:RNA polymerase sigma-70 factor, ECF subfamily
VGSVDDYRGVAPQDRVGEALDVAGFEVLYGRLLPVVYGYFLRRVGGDVPLAEDLTQEAFLSAVRSLPAAIESPEGWMVTIARRRFIDHLRREGRNPQVVAMSVDVVGGVWPPDWSHDERRVTVALSRLEPSHRLALVLHHVDDLPVVEVADLLERSVVATESLLARARRSLRAAFEETTDD